MVKLRLAPPRARVQLPGLTSRLAHDGMTVVAAAPDAFAQFLAKETEKFARVIEQAGIKGSL